MHIFANAVTYLHACKHTHKVSGNAIYVILGKKLAIRYNNYLCHKVQVLQLAIVHGRI